MLGRLALDTTALVPKRERITILRELQRSIRVDVNRFNWVDDMNVLHYEYTLGEYVVAVIYSRKLGRSGVMIFVVLVL
jgi:hypothetical protein